MSARRMRLVPLLLVVLMTLCMVGSYAASAVGSASAAPVGISSASTPASPTPSPALSHAPPAQPPGNNSTSTSGPGTFYSTETLPGASFANATCVSASCYSVTNDVSTTETAGGEIVAAYTTLTHASPCPSLGPYSVSNIAITTSSNGGGSWSAVSYVGNPDCAASGYPDAWEPSIATLGNGTLVLVYVEYNLTAGALPPLTPYSWPPTESRLVLTESYDAGIAWTVPQVLNVSNPPTAPPGLQYTPALPSVATFGNTIYVTWMSLTTWNSAGNVALLVSSDGGASWSPTISVSTGFGAGYSMDPQALVLPSGELVIAYTSNVSYSSFFCGANGCVGYSPPVWEGSVWVATSPTNGTIFDYSQVAESVPLGTFAWSPWTNPVSYGPFETPAPQLAYSGTTGEIYLAFTAGQAANGTSFCFYGPSGCLDNNLYFYSSPDNGSTWIPGNIATTVFNSGGVDPTSLVANATDSVTSVSIAAEGSTVYLEAAYYNGSICIGTACGVDTEVVFDTTDNGTSFSAPSTLAADYTPYAYAWTGEYGSIALVNGTPRYFWTLDACPGWTTIPCSPYPYSNLPVSEVVVSDLFNGTGGATLTFDATGLGPGANWTVSVLGNARTGGWNQTLSVSGIPKGVPIFFSVPGVNETNIRYYVLAGAIVPTSPVTLTRNLTVTVDFSPYVPVTIAYEVPDVQGPACQSFGFSELSGCPSFYPGCLGAPMGNYTEACYSYYFNPVPPVGQKWVPYGQVDSVGLAQFPNPVCWYYYGGVYGYTYCYIYEFYLEPLGWTGTGPGSVSTTALNITFYPKGPVTETASFIETGYCMAFYENFTGSKYYNNYGCENFTDPLTIEETGLPAGTSWAVTLSGAAGSGEMTAIAGQAIVNESARVGAGSITPWNIPSGTPGEEWVGTPSVLSPMILPQTSAVVINYTLQPLASAIEPLAVKSVGLPAGLAGNLTFENLDTGAETTYFAASSPFNSTLPAGSYSLNASPVITTTGTSYYPSEIYSTVDLVDNSNQSGTSPSTVYLGGTTTVTVAYSTEYWVSVAAGAGGTATPTSRWIDAGGTVSLTATPNPGYEFLYWVGTGLGATTGPQALLSHVAIVPGGPVSELATFGLTPAPTWTVTVVPSGIPSGQEYSVTLGGTSYSGVGTFTISNLSTDTYAVGVPNAESATSSLVRYVLSTVTASTGLSAGQLTVDANLTLFPAFSTQYLLALSEVGNGTLSLAAGSYWNTSGSTFTVTATPGTGETFAGWWAAVAGGTPTLVTDNETLDLVVVNSATLVAQFVPTAVVPTPTYNLVLNETGLPADALWQAALSPGAGVSGHGASLSTRLENGSYSMSVATVYTTPGVRFVPSPASESVTVAGNSLVLISFVEQALVSVSSSGSGSTSGGGWAVVGSPTTIVANPAPSGWTFSGWMGTGPGSYNGPNATVTLTPKGPVTETATYVTSSTSTSSSSSASWSDIVALGIVVAVLLVVGVVEGYTALRRRKPPAQTTAPARPSRPAPGRPAVGSGSAPRLPPPTPPAPRAEPAAPWKEQ